MAHYLKATHCPNTTLKPESQVVHRPNLSVMAQWSGLLMQWPLTLTWLWAQLAFLVQMPV